MIHSLHDSVHQASGSFCSVVPVMVHPGLPQNLPAKTALPAWLVVIPAVFRIGTFRIFLIGKSVSGGSQSDERLACLRKLIKISRSEEHTSELQSRGHLVCR